MRKFLMTLAAVLCCCMSLWAQPITEQQAMDRALQYMNSTKAPAAARRMAAASKAGKMKAAPVDAHKIYAFNREGGGFVIASADQRALPVLGYSTTGSIDWDNMPENIRFWLKQYDVAMATLEGQTGFLNGNALGDALETDGRAARQPVEPLIKTHWDQLAPYWDLTPTYAGEEEKFHGDPCVTGCGPTALAQVLNYFRWPKSLPDGLPAYDIWPWNDETKPVWHIDALPPVTFDWDNMLDDYGNLSAFVDRDQVPGTEQQQRAVATLMRYCGQAMEAMYGPYLGLGTLTWGGAEVNALVNKMGHPAAVGVSGREIFTIDEWENLIYGELAEGRPVLYGGSSDQGGHAFICDGYDGNGLFHINWGWSGEDDGYFSLAVLNPYNNTSAGSGNSGIGFSMNQDITIYLDPTMEKRPVPVGSLKKTTLTYQDMTLEVYDGNEVGCGFQYNGDDAEYRAADFAFGTIGADGLLTPRFMGDPNDSILHELNWRCAVIDSTAFQPGEWLALYPMLRFRDSEADVWELIPPRASHIVAGRKAKGDFFINVYTEPVLLTLVAGSISKGHGWIGARNDVTVRLRNESKTDIQRTLRLHPMYYGNLSPDEITAETPFTWGDMMENTAFVKAGQEGEVTFSFVPTQGGTVTLQLYASNYDYLGYFPLVLNDTIAGYDAYLENRSYVTYKDGQCIYHVELCDKADAKALAGAVLADSIGLSITERVGDDITMHDNVMHDEFRAYLEGLPEHAGNGDYIFTYDQPFTISRKGSYYMRSRVCLLTDGEYVNPTCDHKWALYNVDPTGIRAIDDFLKCQASRWAERTIDDLRSDSDAWYDLQGRKIVNSKSVNRKLPKGLYIRGNKKIIIK